MSGHQPIVADIPAELVPMPIGPVLKGLIIDYVVHLEVDPTATWCLCPWQIHPADSEKPEGQRRKRRTDNHPECPVHTREGLIMGFIKWATDGSQ